MLNSSRILSAEPTDANVQVQQLKNSIADPTVANFQHLKNSIAEPTVGNVQQLKN